MATQENLRVVRDQLEVNRQVARRRPNRGEGFVTGEPDDTFWRGLVGILEDVGHRLDTGDAHPRELWQLASRFSDATRCRAAGPSPSTRQTAADLGHHLPPPAESRAARNDPGRISLLSDLLLCVAWGSPLERTGDRVVETRWMSMDANSVTNIVTKGKGQAP